MSNHFDQMAWITRDEEPHNYTILLIFRIYYNGISHNQMALQLFTNCDKASISELNHGYSAIVIALFQVK